MKVHYFSFLVREKNAKNLKGLPKKCTFATSTLFFYFFDTVLVRFLQTGSQMTGCDNLDAFQPKKVQKVTFFN